MMREGNGRRDWLRRTGCALKQGREVFGRGYSRMELRVTSDNGLYFSQGTPERMDSVWDILGLKRFHGWNLTKKSTKSRLDNRSRRHVAENFSTQTLTLIAGAFLLLIFVPREAAATDQQVADRYKEVGDQYEAFMMQRLYDQMQQSNRLVEAGDTNNPFAPSHAEMVWRGMLNEQIMKNLAPRRQLGIGDLVERQLNGNIGVGSRVRTLVKSVKKGQEGK